MTDALPVRCTARIRVCHAAGTALAITASLLLSPGRASAQDDRAARASVLFEQGKEALEKGDFAEAASKLAESHRLDAGLGTLLKLARAYEGLGKTASAWAALREARDTAASRQDDERRMLAEERLAGLEKRLMRIRLVVGPEARLSGLEITRNGEKVGEAQWGEDLPFDPDTYLFEARAPGRKTWSQKVQISAEGTSVSVVVPTLGREEPPPAPAPAIAPVEPATDTGARKDDVSHAWRLGAVVRADIDAEGRGGLGMVGLSYGLGSHVEVSAGAAIGKHSGFWGGLTGYLASGPWKPFAFIGTDVLLVEGTAVAGAHVLGGLQWDPLEHLGVIAGMGMVFFPDASMGGGGEALPQLYYVPTVGVQGRL